MNFLIIGPGAMGCLFAARLKKAGTDVTLLDYNEERAEAITRQGIRVEGVTGEYSVPVPVVTKIDSRKFDYIIICVKSNRTLEAVERINDLISQETIIGTLQNGIGNIEILTETFGEKRVLGGISSEGATTLEWGRIRHAGQGTTVFGPEGSAGDALASLVKIFNSAGFKTFAANNVEELIWGKLVINAGINALTAITGLKNGYLSEYETTRSVMEMAVKEAVEVAKAKKITLPYNDPMDRVLKVCRDTANNTASMLQDVLNRRITEVEYINGAIVEEGRKLNIPTPVNHTLTCLVRAIHETYDISLKA